MGERLKPAVLKTVRLERVSGVRIPPPPPALGSLGPPGWEYFRNFGAGRNSRGITVVAWVHDEKLGQKTIDTVARPKNSQK